jgi:hypothetical protein
MFSDVPVPAKAMTTPNKANTAPRMIAPGWMIERNSINSTANTRKTAISSTNVRFLKDSCC